MAISSSTLTTNKYIPQIYSAKLQEKFYATSTVPAICNHDWEGEINGFGDTVFIRTVPTIAIKTWDTAGATVSYDALSMDSSLTLTIDKAKYYAFSVDYIDDFQSDLSIIDITTQDAAMQMATSIDKEVFNWIGSNAARYTNSGVTEFNYNSATGSADSIDCILKMGQKLDEANVPRDGKRWVVINPGMARALKTSDLKAAYLTGDSASPLRNGLVGELDGMKIYISNNLDNAIAPTLASARCNIFAGHECAFTFASQFVKHEMLPLPDKFGYGVKGLQVYGYQTVKKEAIVRAQVAGAA
tara:strand:+ start:7816 stop:8715 length:900 start_codon:yes stop_codon:yes gene_type:complete